MFYWILGGLVWVSLGVIGWGWLNFQMYVDLKDILHDEAMTQETLRSSDTKFLLILSLVICCFCGLVALLAISFVAKIGPKNIPFGLRFKI